jgi:hypothetical protein
MILLNGPYRLPTQVLFSSERLEVSTAVVQYCKCISNYHFHTKITPGRQDQCSSRPMPSHGVQMTMSRVHCYTLILLCKNDAAIPERRHGYH